MTMFDLSELAKWDEVLAALATGAPLRETAPRRDDAPVRDMRLRDMRAGGCPVFHDGARG